MKIEESFHVRMVKSKESKWLLDCKNITLYVYSRFTGGYTRTENLVLENGVLYTAYSSHHLKMHDNCLYPHFQKVYKEYLVDKEIEEILVGVKSNETE